ncbi:glycoside hydrolase family 13 protein [Mucilaginibacter phyllosphaerae]|uniref:Alpha-glucosidase n=1 Tax=Mucilaginibacter phyllosphaerae TaxID=1812349 RepID=A0A4Y8A7Z3_9SPHI|nr:alpha-glucosidase [Mucilaginibacter phyllosphaerae]MBB3970524.1 oligo-1,6-glucosidase [Mucilaginibacter phyllosphaerae]TEW64538.1 alpha-glucosidase [Mucilaginibacter phyllosphaerae]GGH19316.1 alpha-glucosidase [Mucilaginibacter phyllosphaerae]
MPIHKLLSICAAGCLLLANCKQADDKPKNIQKNNPGEQQWWKEAVVYQIYPRSFKDSDGDGIGDLKGITSELDYIKSLGVNTVWLNPVYSSPNDDNGYDVSDYRNIMKDFGTIQDFDALLKGMHSRGIKLVMDLVVNHSSDEHEWFKQSKSSRDNPYRNYYHWWNEEQGKPAYRYSLFDINHDAWRYDSLTRSYYLHYFSRKQPDLNWENPKLRKEIYDIMRFWADKGIDGFRLDAFQFAAKDTTFPAFPKHFEKNFNQYYGVQGNLHGYLQEMNKEVLSKYNVMSVAEGSGNTLEDAHNMVDADRHELNMAYAFEGVSIAQPNGYSLLHFKDVFTKWDSAFAQKGWLSIFLANHDQARLVSRFGNDNPQYREVSSKMLTTFLMSMRGTPYYYNGDELGMTNAGFTKIEDYKDMPTLNEYKHLKQTGGDIPAFLKRQQFECRDNGRTPFQWDNTANAGFTKGAPWLKVNANYTAINKAAQEKDPNSCLNYFRKMVKLRNDNKVLVYGKYTLLDKANPDVYAYTRETGGTKMLVLLNFKNKPATANTGINLSKAKLLISNYAKAGGTTLQPYEAAVYQLN